MGGWNYFSVDGAQIGPSGRLVTALQVHYASNPLVRRDNAGRIIEVVVSDLTTAELMGEWVLNRRMAVGFALPISHATTPSALDIDDGSGVGDLRIAPKLSILGAKKRKGLGLAVKTALSFPTAGDEHEFSTRQFTVTPTLVMEYRARIWRLAANFGYRWLPTRPVDLPALAVGDGVTWAGAFALRPAGKVFEILAEVFATSYTDVSQAANGPRPVEVLGGFKIYGEKGLTFSLGAGGGLVDDFSAPEFRIVGGLTWSMSSVGGVMVQANLDDQDNDGVKDTADGCPEMPEDRDGYEDADGCPDNDNDADGLPDAKDKCPLQAEDHDGYEDSDGCPDTDNDKDGISDANDRCPLHPENRNGRADDDGCPDDERIVVANGRIQHLDRIYFDTGKSTIKPQSYGIMDRIAAAILRRPHLRKIRVEGHTDAFGSESANEKLAQTRAESVRQYLIRSGVAVERLEAQGHGESKLVGDGRSPVDARLSRRVEFVIVESAK